MWLKSLESELHQWGEWTECPVSCGEGVRTRRKNCAYTRSQNSFENCPEPLVQSETCPESPIPCTGIEFPSFFAFYNSQSVIIPGCTPPPDYDPSGFGSDKYYKLIATLMSWAESRRACDADGANLAMIKDDKDMQDIAGNLLDLRLH